jgi:CRP/FNR family transcriptional regulator, cyclic AMP receptor protein
MQALQAVTLLRTARPQTLQFLAQAARSEVHAPGSIVARRGQASHHLMVIVSGFLLVGFDLPDGRRHVVNMVGPGRVQALIPLIDEMPQIHDATARGWVQVLLIPRDAVVAAMNDDSELTWQVLRHLSMRSRRMYEALGERKESALGLRLARILSGLFSEYGADLAVSQEELGDILGATRQSVNLELQTLRESGVIEVGRGRLLLKDDVALRRMCG